MAKNKTCSLNIGSRETFLGYYSTRTKPSILIMKKLLFSLLALFFISAIAFSQQDPKKALGKATRALGAYNLNPTDNDAKLNEAKEMIETALTSDAIAGQVKAWQTKGGNL